MSRSNCDSSRRMDVLFPDGQYQSVKISPHSGLARAGGWVTMEAEDRERTCLRPTVRRFPDTAKPLPMGPAAAEAHGHHQDTTE